MRFPLLTNWLFDPRYLYAFIFINYYTSIMLKFLVLCWGWWPCFMLNCWWNVDCARVTFWYLIKVILAKIYKICKRFCARCVIRILKGWFCCFIYILFLLCYFSLSILKQSNQIFYFFHVLLAHFVVMHDFTDSMVVNTLMPKVTSKYKFTRCIIISLFKINQSSRIRYYCQWVPLFFYILLLAETSVP